MEHRAPHVSLQLVGLASLLGVARARRRAALLVVDVEAVRALERACLYEVEPERGRCFVDELRVRAENDGGVAVGGRLLR